MYIGTNNFTEKCQTRKSQSAFIWVSKWKKKFKTYFPKNQRVFRKDQQGE